MKGELIRNVYTVLDVYSKPSKLGRIRCQQRSIHQNDHNPVFCIRIIIASVVYVAELIVINEAISSCFLFLDVDVPQVVFLNSILLLDQRTDTLQRLVQFQRWRSIIFQLPARQSCNSLGIDRVIRMDGRRSVSTKIKALCPCKRNEGKENDEAKVGFHESVSVVGCSGCIHNASIKKNQYNVIVETMSVRKFFRLVMDLVEPDVFGVIITTVV